MTPNTAIDGPELLDHTVSPISRLDLHVHTVLSPCADYEMTPRRIVAAAQAKGLNAIAITDHNSCRNCNATILAAEGSGVFVAPGIEICSIEEVHVLGLFPDMDSANNVQEEVYSRLKGENNEEVFGIQVVVDEHDFVEDIDNRLLIGATTLSINKVVELIHRHGGIAIASHVDRRSFGIFGQLGFIPEDLELDALEVSKHMDWNDVRLAGKLSGPLSIVRSSDAHFLDDLGSAYSEALLDKPTFGEIYQALKNLNGRRILGANRVN